MKYDLATELRWSIIEFFPVVRSLERKFTAPDQFNKTVSLLTCVDCAYYSHDENFCQGKKLQGLNTILRNCIIPKCHPSLLKSLR
jgi:hypothetical protein